MVARGRAEQQAVGKVRQLLHRRFKVMLKSGRVLLGDFSCLDPQGNLILSNACELVSNGEEKMQCERPMGMVLVMKSQQEQVLMEVSLSERMGMMNLTAV